MFSVSENILGLTFNSYIYAFNRSGKSLLPENWKGQNMKVDCEYISFDWTGTLYVFDKEGKRVI